MSKFNKKTNNTTKNLAGGKAFKMFTELELLHAVLTTFLNDKYYESAKDRLERVQELIAACSPEYVAKLAFVARSEFHLRSISHVLLGELSKTHGTEWARKAIINTVERVDDITELVSYLDFKLSKQVKRGIRRALYKFNRYQLAKYRSEGKSVKLVDVFNMVHPKPQFATKQQQQAWKDLIEGNLKQEHTWENEISKHKAGSQESAKTWTDLVLENKIGYMALLRNLNNLIKNNVSDRVINKAIEKLTNREEVKRSKQLPFRFITAYENVSGNRQLTDAISLAMDYAVDNVPTFKGNTLIAIDSSASMMPGWSDNYKGAIEHASIFGATLAKANANADIILFDNNIVELSLSTRTPIVDLVSQIKSKCNGGGTYTNLVFQYATQQNKKYDRIIILSDNQSWVGGWNDSPQNAYNDYKKRTNSNPFIYAIDIEGYGTNDIASDKVFHLAGWSDRLLDFIGKVEDGDSLIKYIKSIELNG